SHQHQIIGSANANQSRAICPAPSTDHNSETTKVAPIKIRIPPSALNQPSKQQFVIVQQPNGNVSKVATSVARPNHTPVNQAVLLNSTGATSRSNVQQVKFQQSNPSSSRKSAGICHICVSNMFFLITDSATNDNASKAR